MDSPPPKYAKSRRGSSPSRAFIILVIIILLLGYFLLLPFFRGRGEPGYDWRMARQEMKSLEAAILQYQAIYNRWPVSNERLTSRTNSDLTFGMQSLHGTEKNPTNSSTFEANNSELMAVLMDLTQFPESGLLVNSNHMLNPQRYALFSARMANDTKSRGIGRDGVLRDSWGNPYIITIDLNDDGYCRDAFYQMASVSEVNPTNQAGIKKLTRATRPPYNPETRDTFQIKGSVMIWSMGPDGKADPSIKADEGVNKDNILSWE